MIKGNDATRWLLKYLYYLNQIMPCLAQYIQMDDSRCDIGVGPRQGNTALSLLKWPTDTDGSEAHSLFKNARP